MDIPLPGEIPLPGLSNSTEIPLSGFFDRFPPPPPSQPPVPAFIPPPGPPPPFSDNPNFINQAFNPSGPPPSKPGFQAAVSTAIASKPKFPPPSDDVDVLFQPPTHKDAAADDPDFYSPFSPSRVSRTILLCRKSFKLV